MSKKPDVKKADAEIVTLFAVQKVPGDGWTQAFALSEYQIPADELVKHAKQISRQEPDLIQIVLNTLGRRVRETLGL